MTDTGALDKSVAEVLGLTMVKATDPQLYYVTRSCRVVHEYSGHIHLNWNALMAAVAKLPEWELNRVAHLQCWDLCINRELIHREFYNHGDEALALAKCIHAIISD